MFQCIIFDVDGTLIDTEFADKKSLQKVLIEETGKEYALDDLDFMLGIPGHDALEILGVTDIAKAKRKWNQYMNDFHDEIRVFDGVERMLMDLKANNIVTGIVTSKTRLELENDFIPFGLMRFLDFYVCADNTKKHKPNPDPILKFLEISGVSNQQAIYIGDTMYDFKAATAANVKFGLALWGAKNHETINAFVKIDQPADIFEILVKN